MTHEHSTPGSQHICDLVVSRIEAVLGDISAKHAESVCSLGKNGKFAYAYHRRDGVRVYLRSRDTDEEKLASLVPASGGLVLKKRQSMRSGWAKLSPFYLDLDSDESVTISMPILLHVAQNMRTVRKVAKTYLLPSESEAIEILEGGRTTVQVNRFERDPVARKRCIRIFGASCAVCGFDFGRIYGDIGVGFIHVHHLIPLSMIRKKYRVNANTDLRPVCPNCHEMLHRQTPPLSVEELKRRISRAVND